MALSSSVGNDDEDRRDYHVQKGEREKHLPTEPHDLIVAKSRHAPAEQNLQPAEKPHFQRECPYLQQHDREMRQQPGDPPGKMKPVEHEIGHLPATEEKCRGEPGGG